jgi:hypothetical protein
MSVGRYFGLTATLAVLTSGLALAWVQLDSGARWAVALGAGLSALNSTAAYALALVARRRAKLSAFMLYVLGGMGARLGLMLAVVAAAMFWLKLPQTALTVSVLAYFALFLILELAFLQTSPGIAATEAQ